MISLKDTPAVVKVNDDYELRFTKKVSGGRIYYVYKNNEPYLAENGRHMFCLLSNKQDEYSSDLVLAMIEKKVKSKEIVTEAKPDNNKPKRNTFKDADCPNNLLKARTDARPIVRISGALCEAIKLNQQVIVEEALEQITVEELKELLNYKESML
jgi:hypothetical protein